MKGGKEVFPIILRDGDELGDVTDILNETLVVIQDRHLQQCRVGSREYGADVMLAGLSALRAQLEALPTSGQSPPTLADWAADMSGLIDKLESEATSQTATPRFDLRLPNL